MKVYLASSLRNHSANAIIADVLRQEGVQCFVPQEAYPIAVGGESDNLARSIYETNRAALDSASVVVAVGYQMGTDTAWECGYAVAQRKQVILVELRAGSTSKMYMVYSPIEPSMHIKVETFTREHLAPLLRVVKNALLGKHAAQHSPAVDS